MELKRTEETSDKLLLGIEQLIERTGRDVAVYLNTEISRLYWSIGNYIIAEIQTKLILNMDSKFLRHCRKD